MQFTLATVFSLLVASAAAAPLLGDGKPVYHEVFKGQTCATQATDYITSSSEKTLQDCFDFCDSVKGCRFVNYYEDLGAAKPGFGTIYTCAAYYKVHGTKDNTNCGGQSQVPPFKNTIKNSSGYYKHVGLFGRD